LGPCEDELVSATTSAGSDEEDWVILYSMFLDDDSIII